MASVNKVILVGNLGQDPELKQLDNDNHMCKFSVATTRKWKNKQGEPQEKVDWHQVITWGKQALNCAQYLSKGKQVYVEGRTERRDYTDKDGVNKPFFQVQAYMVQFLGSNRSESDVATAPRTALVKDGSMEEELPF